MSTSYPPDPDAEDAADAETSEAASEADLLTHYDILRVRAPNPGPVTLSGTNTWVVGREPAWVVDPGPLIEEHLTRLFAAVEERGGLGGVALTHDHHDHSEAAEAVRKRYSGAGRGRPRSGRRAAGGRDPLRSLRGGLHAGHAADHYALIADGACFCGDAVLGEGSVFISPYRGAMCGYLLALTRLRLREDFNVLCPGHGPPVWDAHTKLEEYVAHRLDRENNLILALGKGARTVAELLDAVWSDVPEELRPLATATLAAHLDKLEDDQILPAGVERPRFERTEW